ncbi:M15 family metallopeptidase [Hymenobacter psychrotolerans]|uniref:Peptidoglycan L-alanyl-D-glutamate endopeptidase CwlK n=1 Tax=Hymenobacter psychrotolerans DSM 18569 TaxID=1121959 RepID=A0A1M7D7W6_9BACT|nr:M15 family metallopeptidase [Hymenobacter psychrotolerans]SHL75602.1 peptidoglycan L-alanyl-D-glutamate endopeptidase CwlK [Hymenobacter psychrotolerans DSM 18569]
MRPEQLPQLTGKQLATQAHRLNQALPHLAAAYAQALGRWLGDPVLRLVGRPIITECYRSPERQNELYAQGRTKPGLIVTYKRGGESKHNLSPTPALDVAFLLADGSVSWSGLLLSKFARLMKAADARVVWGGDWLTFKDRPHFEVLAVRKGGDGRG